MSKVVEQNVYLERCLCCGMPEHLIIKPTKKILRYHAYCSYCKFSAFLRKSDVKRFVELCRKDREIPRANFANKLIFDNGEFLTVLCMFCFSELEVKKCAMKNKDKRVVYFGCKDCCSRFFIPVIFLDYFYLI